MSARWGTMPGMGSSSPGRTGARIAGDMYQWLHVWEACLVALTDRVDGAANPVLSVGVEADGYENLDDVQLLRNQPPHFYSQVKYAVDASTPVSGDFLLKPTKSGGPSILAKIAVAARR